MNATEAMETIEKMIIENEARIHSVKNYLSDDFFKPSTSELEMEIEALTIVLKSAELFHEYHVPEIFESSKQVVGHKKHEKLYGVPLKDLGIELTEKTVDKKNKENEQKEDINN